MSGLRVPEEFRRWALSESGLALWEGQDCQVIASQALDGLSFCPAHKSPALGSPSSCPERLGKAVGEGRVGQSRLLCTGWVTIPIPLSLIPWYPGTWQPLLRRVGRGGWGWSLARNMDTQHFCHHHHHLHLPYLAYLSIQHTWEQCPCSPSPLTEL